MLKGALHVHTTWSDGVMSPQEAIDLYAAEGFDFMAVTDHDHLLKRDYLKQPLTAPNGFIIFAGVELTVFENGYLHVLRIGGNREQLHVFCHPAEYNMSFEELLSALNKVASRMPIEAVEVTSKGFYTPEYDTDRIPWPKVATDDAHTPLGVGRAWIEVDCGREPDEILAAVKLGRIGLGFR